MPDRRAGVVVVGHHPPPVHGMASVNAAMVDHLRSAGCAVTVLNTAPKSLDRRWSHRLSRIPALLQAARALLATPARVAYFSVSGGRGQMFELCLVLLARLRGTRPVLHHHSFAYINRRSRLTALLAAGAGRSARHIALCGCMAEGLRRNYPAIGRLTTLSNAAIFALDAQKSRIREGVAVVGLISNLSRDKGVFDALDLAEALKSRGSAVRILLAGPFDGPETEAAVRSRAGAAGNVEVLGPVYGVDKDRFFERIDVLLFPSRYVNEAEPVTIYEAMARGIPVIASDRGCIPEVVGDLAGAVTPIDVFVDVARRRIEAWSADGARMAAASAEARARCLAIAERDGTVLQELLAEWCGSAQPSPR